MSDLQNTMVHHSNELHQLEDAIDKMKAVQEFAPMFHGALTTLQVLREKASLAYNMARRDYVDAEVLPLIIESVPSTLYTAMYVKTKSWGAGPEEMFRFKQKTELLADLKLTVEPHLVAEVNETGYGEDRKVTVSTIYDVSARNLIRMEKWARENLEKKAAAKVKTEERKARKKVYDAWAKQVLAETGEEVPKFGAKDAYYYFKGSGFREPGGKVALPEGIDFQ